MESYANEVLRRAQERFFRGLRGGKDLEEPFPPKNSLLILDPQARLKISKRPFVWYLTEPAEESARFWRPSWQAHAASTHWLLVSGQEWSIMVTDHRLSRAGRQSDEARSNIGSSRHGKEHSGDRGMQLARCAPKR